MNHRTLVLIEDIGHNLSMETINISPSFQENVELIERLVLSMTDAGDWVLDPFMGVGTTAIAALMHHRKAIGAEILPKYIEITKERIRLAESGKLKVRPMDRPVYDPGAPDVSKPPVEVHLGNSSYQPDEESQV
jgi:adenine-specific DNA-methyltransferase